MTILDNNIPEEVLSLLKKKKKQQICLGRKTRLCNGIVVIYKVVRVFLSKILRAISKNL